MSAGLFYQHIVLTVNTDTRHHTLGRSFTLNLQPLYNYSPLCICAMNKHRDNLDFVFFQLLCPTKKVSLYVSGLSRQVSIMLFVCLGTYLSCGLELCCMLVLDLYRHLLAGGIPSLLSCWYHYVCLFVWMFVCLAHVYVGLQDAAVWIGTRWPKNCTWITKMTHVNWSFSSSSAFRNIFSRSDGKE